MQFSKGYKQCSRLSRFDSESSVLLTPIASVDTYFKMLARKVTAELSVSFVYGKGNFVRFECTKTTETSDFASSRKLSVRYSRQICLRILERAGLNLVVKRRLWKASWSKTNIRFLAKNSTMNTCWPALILHLGMGYKKCRLKLAYKTSSQWNQNIHKRTLSQRKHTTYYWTVVKLQISDFKVFYRITHSVCWI